MNRCLTSKEIEYVWMHFGHHYEIGSETKQLFVYSAKSIESELSISNKKKSLIYFPLSDIPVSEEPYFDSQQTLVLFPLSSQSQPYKIENENLIFNHDYLKSIFYLLSGYQEWNVKKYDASDRISYPMSLQGKYSLPLLPYVNSMMDILAEALEEYCKPRDLTFHRKPLWGNCVFLLSHDIDHIRRYRLSYFKYKLKELAGVVVNKQYSKYELASQFVHGLKTILTGKLDPSWSFDFMQAVNDEADVKSTYFFLTKEGRHDGSFDIQSPKIRNLIQEIQNAGNEVATHGTLASCENLSSAKNNLQQLQNVSKSHIQGIRQHWLKYKFPATAQIHDAMGYDYDASLGFHDQVGFRHGYCFPFKLWDFEHQKPFNTWEIPLCVMEISLLIYMGFSIDECEKEISKWCDEVKKRGGVFSLLWHNTILNEKEIPGVRERYRSLIKLLASEMDNRTHGEVADHMNSRTANK